MARKRSEGTEVKMDMTPMIDVVFLMIIFFLIVSDLTQQDLAEIFLPKADQAQEDEMTKGRMIVNIYGEEQNKDGEIEIKRQAYPTLDDSSAVQALRNYLAVEVQKGEIEPDGTSERPLLVRADKTTQFKHVQKVMRVCGENGIRIYKIELAAAQNEQ